MAKKQRDAFDVTLSDDQKKTYADEWCREIEDAFAARADVIGQGGKVDYLHWFYEQGRSRDSSDTKFRDRADLTSYLITSSVDALRARFLRAITSADPICTVDGFGKDASKAPAVEAFMDWQAHETGLLDELSKLAHSALLSDLGVIEVRERIETKRTTEELDVALELDELTGGPIIDAEAGQPKLKIDPETGDYQIAQDDQPAARVRRTITRTKRLGPEYDVIPLRDFVYLPGHARNLRQVWGYAKRFHERMPDIREKVADGIYDGAAVERLGAQSDRDGQAIPPTVNSVVPQLGDAVEKELFELTLKRDLDGDGREEWYVATVSLQFRELLRLKVDTFTNKVGRPRVVPFVPCPREDSVYGYIYAEKLVTLAEEHTALRNSTTDRSNLAANAPIKRLRGAVWDPDLEPFGVGATITVADMNEVQQMQVQDAPQSSIFLMRDILQANERVGGLSDVAVIGTGGRESNTLGQDQMVAAASNVRVEEMLGPFRRALSHIYALSHAVWVDSLEADRQGLEAPAGLSDALQVNDVELANGRFLASQIAGRFQFKPYGSDETADLNRQQMSFNQGLQSLAGMAKVFTPLAMIFQNPDVAKAILEEWARVNRVRNKTVFLRALRPPMAGLPAAGGMSPGAPMAAPEGAGMPPGLAGLLAQASGGGTVPAPQGGPFG